MTVRKTRKKERPEKTTMRAKLSGEESEALKDFLRGRCGGLTIDSALRQALDMWLKKGAHTSLSEITSRFRARRETADGLVQEELF